MRFTIFTDDMNTGLLHRCSNASKKFIADAAEGWELQYSPPAAVRLMAPNGIVYDMNTPIPCEIFRLYENLRPNPLYTAIITERSGVSEVSDALALKFAPELFQAPDYFVPHQMTVKEARTLRGLTQSELANITGMSLRQMQKIETGESRLDRMTSGNFLAMAKALNIDPFELIQSNQK